MGGRGVGAIEEYNGGRGRGVGTVLVALNIDRGGVDIVKGSRDSTSVIPGKSKVPGADGFNAVQHLLIGLEVVVASD